jgi:hypoxanthine-guanine phosphoribosyltransferase
MSTSTLIGQLRPVIAAEQIQKRLKEMARQISDDYRWADNPRPGRP